MAYGWGNNSFLQLSHEDEYNRFSNPLMVAYSPLPFDKLSDKFVKNVAAGDNFSVLVVEDKGSQDIEIYSTGVNKWGQLGQGEFTDCSDLNKIQSLSNLQYEDPAGGVKPVDINRLSCGLNHCLAQTNVGLLFEWGANLSGQLGNKRKTNSEIPIIVSSLVDRQVVDLACGYNSTGVILTAKQADNAPSLASLA